MLKKSLLILCFVFSQAVSRTIEPYDSKYKERVLEIAFERPELFLPGLTWLSKYFPKFLVNIYINEAKIVFKQRLEQSLVASFVVIDNAEVVGFISFFKTKLNRDEEFVLIESIAVASSHWHKGHGKALLEHALEYIVQVFAVKGLKPAYIELYVDAKNKNAQALYEKYEFKNVPSAMNAMGIQTMRREIK